MRCAALNPCEASWSDDSACDLEEGHTGLHSNPLGRSWATVSKQPAVPAEIADARTLAAHERELSGVGFTREELTAAAARQQRIPPTKDEILAAINEANAEDLAKDEILADVTKLFTDRGL